MTSKMDFARISPPQDVQVAVAGTTLVELLVALALTGAMISAGYAAFASIVEHRERADQLSSESIRATAVRRTLSSWLSGAQVAGEASSMIFEGIDAENDGLADDQVTFLTTARTPAGSPAIVRIYIDRNPGTPEQGMTAEFHQVEGLTRKQVEIDRRVAGLDVSYLFGRGSERRWLSGWVSASGLPAAARLQLLPGRPDTLPALLQLPIIAPLAGGL